MDTTCKLCEFTYVKGLEGDEKKHLEKHKRVAKGALPKGVREFVKSYGYAVAHNDGGIERLKDRYDAETGKLAIAFSWWHRALLNGVRVSDFDAYMNAHLKLVDSLVSHSHEDEVRARALIAKWAKYDA